LFKVFLLQIMRQLCNGGHVLMFVVEIEADVRERLDRMAAF
jgi:hypothetical protein